MRFLDVILFVLAVLAVVVAVVTLGGYGCLFCGLAVVVAAAAKMEKQSK